MLQEPYHDFAPLFDTAPQRSSPAGSNMIAEREAEYYRSRAIEESARADEATHPAARAAHLELAARYRGRALAAG